MYLIEITTEGPGSLRVFARFEILYMKYYRNKLFIFNYFTGVHGECQGHELEGHAGWGGAGSQQIWKWTG